MPNKRRLCGKCEVVHWKSEFPDNFETTSCFFCFFTTKIEDFRQEMKNEIKSIKNIVMPSGEVNINASPPVSHLEKNNQQLHERCFKANSHVGESSAGE